MPGCSTNLDDSRARPTVLAVDAGGSCLDSFLFPVISLFFFPLSLRDGWIQMEILSQRVVNPKTTNEITNTAKAELLQC